MTLTPEQKEEFRKLTEPIIEWLNNNCYQHYQVEVDASGAMLSAGVHAFADGRFLKD